MVGDGPPRLLEILVLVHESESTSIEVCSNELKGGNELEHFFAQPAKTMARPLKGYGTSMFAHFRCHNNEVLEKLNSLSSADLKSSNIRFVLSVT